MIDHVRLLPISKKQLAEYCSKNNIDVGRYRVLEKSNLLYNACLAPSCPHYLKPGSMRKHLGTWSEKCPKGFHMIVKNNYKQNTEFIFTKFINH